MAAVFDTKVRSRAGGPEVTRCSLAGCKRSRFVEAVMAGVVMGVVAVWLMTAASAVAGPGSPEIKSTRHKDGATVTLRAGDLTVTQTFGKTGVALRLSRAGDVLEFAADLTGRVTLQRASAHSSFMVRSASRQDQERLNQILANSPALDAFDELLQSPWARSAEAAAIFRSTREVLRVLQTADHAPEALVAVRPPAATPAVTLVRQRLSPSQCWDTYSRDVVHFTYELQSCIGSVSSQWWNPFALAWCAYEYNLKSSLASIWLLDCYGVGV
jgi:hypothetical protein